jgi:DNA-binding MarR family transcriptional regulator
MVIREYLYLLAKKSCRTFQVQDITEKAFFNYETGFPLAEVGRQLGVTTSAISKAISRLSKP